MIKGFRKAIAICMVGFGLGILLVLLLPWTWWLFIIGLCVVCAGLSCLCR